VPSAAGKSHQREADWNDPMVTTLPGGYCVCNGRRGGNLQMWDVIGGFGAAARQTIDLIWNALWAAFFAVVNVVRKRSSRGRTTPK
jgi:hypothetical protein